ncbi:MAG: transcriptional repressor LexA [Eubacteriales bacterium]|nr:transcriptional repressor LexA [Eubacteriales bacterium]
MKKMSDKQKNVLEFVQSEVKEKGYPPSVREICKALNIKSTSTVHSYLNSLEEQGLIHKDATKPRAIKLLKTDEDKIKYPEFTLRDNTAYIPIVGRVTAGQPILAVENITDTFPVPAGSVKSSTSFMLQVKGESMIEAGILDGDLILVRQQQTAENGDIVVALIGDEATVKRFYKEKNYIRLQPENRYMEPIIVKDNVSIIGKVTGLYRTY